MTEKGSIQPQGPLQEMAISSCSKETPGTSLSWSRVAVATPRPLSFQPQSHLEKGKELPKACGKEFSLQVLKLF